MLCICMAATLTATSVLNVNAAASNAPLILTKDGGTAQAETYVTEEQIESGFVLGRTGVLADETVVNIFHGLSIR